MTTALATISKEVADLVAIYGEFDLGLDGLPRSTWIGKHLVPFHLGRNRLQHYLFPEVYLHSFLVNRRMFPQLAKVFEEIENNWTPTDRTTNGLGQFVKCWCFGEGDRPTPTWWGASYTLSPNVGPELLEEVTKLFVRHGFTPGKIASASNVPKESRRFDFY